MRLRKRLFIGAENFGGWENLYPVLITTMSMDMDYKLKLFHKLADVVDRAKTKTCVILLRYNVEKPESSFARVQIFAREKLDEKSQQNDV